MFRWPANQLAPSFARWRGILSFTCIQAEVGDEPQYLGFVLSPNTTVKLWFGQAGLVLDHTVSNVAETLAKDFSELDAVEDCSPESPPNGDLPTYSTDTLMCFPLFGLNQDHYFPFQIEFTAPQLDNRSSAQTVHPTIEPDARAVSLDVLLYTRIDEVWGFRPIPDGCLFARGAHIQESPFEDLVGMLIEVSHACQPSTMAGTAMLKMKAIIKSQGFS